jgi:hypothetical protein
VQAEDEPERMEKKTERPKSVICSNASMNQGGRCRAPLRAARSMRSIEATMAAQLTRMVGTAWAGGAGSFARGGCCERHDRKGKISHDARRHRCGALLRSVGMQVGGVHPDHGTS